MASLINLKKPFYCDMLYGINCLPCDKTSAYILNKNTLAFSCRAKSVYLTFTLTKKQLLELGGLEKLTESELISKNITKKEIIDFISKHKIKGELENSVINYL